MPTAEPTLFLNFLIREVYSDHKRVQRNIVIEEVDKRGKTLNYHPTATVMEFDKETGSITIGTDGSLDEGQQKAKEQFDYDAYMLRIMVKNILDSLLTTSVRPSGGVYFVPRHYQKELDRLVDLISRLERSEAFAVPLFDTKSNRGMVNSKLQEDDFFALSKCRSVIGQPNPKKGQIADTLTGTKRVVKTSQEYQSIVHLNLEMLNGSLAELVQKAR